MGGNLNKSPVRQECPLTDYPINKQDDSVSSESPDGRRVAIGRFPEITSVAPPRASGALLCPTPAAKHRSWPRLGQPARRFVPCRLAGQHFGVRAGPYDIHVRISGGFGSGAALIWQVFRSS